MESNVTVLARLGGQVAACISTLFALGLVAELSKNLLDYGLQCLCRVGTGGRKREN